MWEQAIQAFEQAAEINRGLPLRRGNVVHLPPDADALLAGDLHGHGPNLLRIEKLAGDLGANPARHVVLQEIIHQIPDQEGQTVAESSHQVLSRVARWQVKHPGRVHVIIGNHELAQMTGQDILKYGTGICKAFTESVQKRYGEEADDLLRAMNDYFRSLPLAVRLPGGLAMTHSLPSEAAIAAFDATVFDRPVVAADYQRSGPVYQLLWGRSFGRASIDRIRQALDAQVLVLGHQPQPTGWLAVDNDALIIASDHDHGVVLSVPPGPAPDAHALAAKSIPLASVEL